MSVTVFSGEIDDTGLAFSSAIGNFVIGLSPIEGTDIPAGFMPPERIHPDVARLYDTIQTVIPGITLPLVEQMLWNCVEEFCIRSTYFRDRVNWQLAPGASQVDFNPYSADMRVVWVLHQYGLTDWVIIPPAILTDMRTPTAARTGWAILALRPVSFDNIKLGKLPELFTTWWETMLDGTCFRLYAMPTRPWSNQQLATYHGTRFRQGINRARDIAERLHSDQQSPYGPFPYFARGRRKN